MNSNKMYNQIMTLFGGLMAFFYTGLGLYIIMSPDLISIDKVMRVIFGSSLVLYGAFRLYRTYVRVIEVFFTEDEKE